MSTPCSSADERRRSSGTRFDELRAEQKQLGKLIPKAQGDEKAELLKRTKELADAVKAADAEQHEAAEEAQQLLLRLGNIVHPDAPVGGEEDFVVLEQVGTPRDFAAEGFAPKDHLELGELLGAIDTDRGAKVSGSRFYYLTGVGALLELALVNAAIAQATAAGFTPVLTPNLVKARRHGGHRLPRPGRGRRLLPGEGRPLPGRHLRGPARRLPHGRDHRRGPAAAALRGLLRRATGARRARTARTPAASSGSTSSTRWRCSSTRRPEESEAEHQRLLAWEKQWLTSLELPFQVIELASGDLGSSASRKFDCEAWIPTQGKYRELTSTSNTLEFQARRLGIRMRDAKGTRPLATLNGTLCAVTRTIVAILENHQQADGSVRVPEVLRPYLGGRELLEPAPAPAR